MIPFKYQEEGVEYLCSNTRALLADGMGMGKTLQAVLACKTLDLERILVICPASLRFVWKNEISKVWPEGLDRFDIRSYNFFQKAENAESYSNMPVFDCMICDEAHALKSWSSNQTKNIVMKLSKKMLRIILLTGTPAVRSAADYHPLLSILEPGVHGKYKDFCNQYCHARKGFSGGIFYYGFKNTEELSEKVKKVSLRRLKKDKCLELPDKIHTVIPVDLLKEDNAPTIAELVAIEDGLEKGVAPESLAEKLHAIGLEKVKYAVDWINACGEPLVVFAWHRDVIKSLLEGIKADCFSLMGGSAPGVKEKLVEDFQLGTYHVAVVNIAVGGMGITLTRASHVLFVEPCWSPALMQQCEDRVHRIGQDAECVNIYHLIARGTIDDAIYRTLSDKSRGINAVIEKDI